jgi:hypothetical protein
MGTASGLLEHGTVQESKLPSVGLPRLTGFEELVEAFREAAWIAGSRQVASRRAQAARQLEVSISG